MRFCKFMIREDLKKFIELELDELGMELVDLQMNVLKSKTILKIFIDKKGATTDKCELNISDCEIISRALEAVLDVEGVFNSYVLEVSTPGLERNLSNIKDYNRFKGKLASVTLLDEVLSLGTFFNGIIEGVDGENILFRLSNEDQLSVDFNNIKKAKLKYEGK